MLRPRTVPPASIGLISVKALRVWARVNAVLKPRRLFTSPTVPTPASVDASGTKSTRAGAGCLSVSWLTSVIWAIRSNCDASSRANLFSPALTLARISDRADRAIFNAIMLVCSCRVAIPVHRNERFVRLTSIRVCSSLFGGERGVPPRALSLMCLWGGAYKPVSAALSKPGDERARRHGRRVCSILFGESRHGPSRRRERAASQSLNHLGIAANVEGESTETRMASSSAGLTSSLSVPSRALSLMCLGGGLQASQRMRSPE